MSFTTPKVLFTPPVTQGTTADALWNGVLNNITVDDTTAIAYTIYDMGVGDKSRVLTMSGPKFLGEVPASATVSNILIEYRCWRGYGVDNTDSKLQIGNGTIRTNGWGNSAGYSNEIVSGTLTFWGLTDAQAMQFVAGTLPLKLWAEATASGPLANQTNYLMLVKAQVTWDVPAGAINLPQVF